MLKTSTKYVLIAACLVLVACAQKPAKKAPEPIDMTRGVVAPVLSPEAQAEFDSARTLLRQGDINAAKAAFESLEKRLPTLAGVKTNLAIIAMQNGLIEKALNKAREASALNPGNAEAYTIEGQAMVLLGDYYTAERAYSKAVQLAPQSPYPHYGLGVVYDLYLQNLELAEEHYEAYLRLADRSRDAATIEQVEGWLKILERKK